MNTIVLSLDKYPPDLDEDFKLSIVNYVLSGIFLIECVVKIVAFGPRNYFQYNANKFDFVLVLISMLEVCFENIYDSNFTALQSLRVFRLLRVFKLARFWSGLYKNLMIMYQAFSDVTFFGIIIYLFVFMFTILG